MVGSCSQYGSRYRYLVLFTSCFATFVAAFIFQLFSPIMTLVISDFQISYAYASLLITVFVLPAIFLSIPAGILTDRCGPKLLGTLSLILSIVGIFVIVVSAHFEMVLVGRLISGIGFSFIFLIAFALGPQWFSPNELGRAIAMILISYPLGIIIAFNTLGGLGLAYGWRFCLYVGILLCMATTVIWHLIVKRGPYSRATDERDVYWSLKIPEIWKIGLALFFFEAAIISFLTWAPTFFVEIKGMNLVFAGFLVSLVMITQTLFTPVVGWISDKTGKYKLLAFLGCALTSMTLLGIVASGIGLIVVILTLGITLSIAYSPLFTLIGRIFPARVGSSFGIVIMFIHLSSTFAPLFISHIYDVTGSLFACLGTMSIFSLLAAITVFTFRTR